MAQKTIIINFYTKHKKNIIKLSLIMFNLICLIIFCNVILTYTYNPIWNFFGDPTDYLIQSKMSLWSSDFYMPTVDMGLSPRPFTVPLFYKMVNSDPLSIVWMQKIAHCIASFALITSLLLIIKNKIVSFLTIPLLYYFFTWWPIVGFTENLLSESLSMSFLFIWISATILCIHYKNSFAFIYLCIITVLFSFTRDTWPYIILLAGFLLAVYFYKKDKKLKKYFVIFCFLNTGLFLFQSYTSRVGERYKIPIYNVLATRISKKPEYLNWFSEKGMPLTDSLSSNFKNIDLTKNEDIIKVYNSYLKPTYKPLHHWIVEYGKNTYMLFMLTHPSYFFLSDESDFQKERIFTIIDKGYIVKSEEPFLYDNATRDVFSIGWVLILIVSLMLLTIKIKGNTYYYLLPLFLGILFLVNVYLSYNADTLEVERHLFITEIMIQFIFYITLIFLVDILTLKLTEIIANKKNDFK